MSDLLKDYNYKENIWGSCKENFKTPKTKGDINMWAEWNKISDDVIPYSTDTLLFCANNEMYIGSIVNYEWVARHINKKFKTEEVEKWTYIPEELLENK